MMILPIRLVVFSSGYFVHNASVFPISAILSPVTRIAPSRITSRLVLTVTIVACAYSILIILSTQLKECVNETDELEKGDVELYLSISKTK